TALFMFDWIITLDQEINVVWKRRCSLGTVLFVLTRYSTLAYSSQAIWGIYSVITNTKVLSLAVRISASLADILVLLITWYKTATVYRTSRKHGITSPLTTLLIRDG
ncbi:hypothetical protein BDW22DRAFT_1298840, partial [Trametopsis cervina]